MLHNSLSIRCGFGKSWANYLTTCVPKKITSYSFTIVGKSILLEYISGSLYF
jgi:hypothetical protein